MDDVQNTFFVKKIARSPFHVITVVLSCVLFTLNAFYNDDDDMTVA